MIEKITIKVGKKKVDLTLEEAKVLKVELDSIFSPTFIPYCPQPIYIEPYSPTYIPPPMITWSNPTCLT